MSKYEDIETLRDPDGVVAVITRREGSGHLTFRLQKEYVVDGEVKVTSYLGIRHLPAVERLRKRLQQRLDVLGESAKVERARASYRQQQD